MNFHAAYDATLEYVRRVLVGIDMLGNVVLLNGTPGETISYHAAVDELQKQQWACVLCKWLNWFQSDHCGKTLAADDQQRLLWGEAVARGDHPL